MLYKLRTILFLISVLPVTNLTAQTNTAFTSIELQATSAYLNYKGNECRMGRLIFHGGKNFGTAEVTVSMNGAKLQLTIPASSPGITSFDLPFPGAALTRETQATVQLVAGEKTYEASALFAPAKKWTVYVLPHSHVDIGYTNVQEKVLKLHMENIDESIALAEKTKSYPEGSRFKWNTEAVWVVDNYLATADAGKRKRFWDAVKAGSIGVDAAYGNINTSATGSRQLLQMFYEGIRQAKDNGVEMTTMFQGDVPGSSIALATQSAHTGIRYFLSGPNASDRIGYLAQWQDRPFYWLSPSGKEKLLFWQCQPYSIGYRIKGSKIPNFFTVEDPKPYYTGEPSKYFLNPDIFNYLGDLEKKGFPYDMTLVTWAMSDNSPIDPELPDAVKEWNEKFASPKMVICTTTDFFQAFEKKFSEQVPVITGDYTEYWTDGLGSAARETAINRNASEKLTQADIVMAVRNRQSYPLATVNEAWKNILLFSEHTWGAYNSVSQPEDAKVKSQWRVKQAFALNGGKMADSLLKLALGASKGNEINVYNPNSWERSDLVIVPASMSKKGDQVKDAAGKILPSQRLKSGELAFIADKIPALGSKRFVILNGTYAGNSEGEISNNAISNGIYQLQVDPNTGDITSLSKKGIDKNFADTGFNQYIYLPGDSLEKKETSLNNKISVGENGPLVKSLVIESEGAGIGSLKREIRLVNGIDRVEIINTVDKKPVRRKESVLFSFPFSIPGAQVRYAIPWGSVNMEAGQLPFSNRNWYTIQRWLDISNAEYGVTWSSPDAPLLTIGKISIARLLGGLHHSPLWLKFSEQSSRIFSWPMNNLWHTNFPAMQEGVVQFRYYFNIHNQYDEFETTKRGFENSWPLLVGAADKKATSSLFTIQGENVYAEAVKPATDGDGYIIYLVNAGMADSDVTLTGRNNAPLQLWQTNLLEEKIKSVANGFSIPARGILVLRMAFK